MPHPIRSTIAALGLFWAAVVFVTLALAVIGGLAIWIATATSAARGNAAVTRQHNSGANQVAQNTTLLGDSQAVIADQQKIEQMASIPSGEMTQQDLMNLYGAEQVCDTDVATYNAAVRNVLAQGLLPAGLPTAYSATTECEAN
jgi:hypothetical protein